MVAIVVAGDAAGELFSEHGEKLSLDQVLARREMLKA